MPRQQYQLAEIQLKNCQEASILADSLPKDSMILRFHLHILKESDWITTGLSLFMKKCLFTIVSILSKANMNLFYCA